MSDDSHEYDEDALEFIEDERVRIAALHATCPNEIWLQIDPEAEQFDGWEAQTWCSDKINETDVRYVLAASRDAEVAKAFEAGRQSVDTPVALAEAYRCGEEAGRVAGFSASIEACQAAGPKEYPNKLITDGYVDAIRARSTK